MEPQVAEYQERLIDEARTLDVRQMRRLLQFVEEIKRTPTEETLLAPKLLTGNAPAWIQDR